MGILTWIIFGLIAGAIAKAIHPDRPRRLDCNNYYRYYRFNCWRMVRVNDFWRRCYRL